MKQLEKILNQDSQFNQLIGTLNAGSFPRDFEIERLGKESKHTSYLVLIDGQPKFVIKRTPYARKEEKFIQFSRLNEIYPSVETVWFSDYFFITAYKDNLTVCPSPFEYIADLAKQHAKQLIAGIDYTSLETDDFINVSARKTIERINKHTSLVRNFCPDLEKLVSFLERNNYDAISELKILAHGDAHNKNVLCSKNEFIYLDFELAVLDKSTWDLTRIFLDLTSDGIHELVDQYVKFICGHIGNHLKLNAEDFKKIALSDFVKKYSNVGIGVQQHEYFRDKAQKYIIPIKRHFEWILSSV